ncbi:MAG: hypothetical protein JXR83_21920, partial [Deltaproteobacteria bacterium]|nr:hypothetical protein [Deltaproteobacteria bacterium]
DLAVNAGVFSAQSGYREVVVTFDVSESLAGGLLEVRLGDRLFSCGDVQAGALNFTCTYAVDGTEVEGLNIVSVRTVDEAGNESVASAPVRLDFTPPAIASAFVSYVPGPGNPLAMVSRATVGSQIVIVAIADEELDATAVPALTLVCGGQEIASDLAPTTQTGGTVTFNVQVPALDFDGDCTPAITWTDLVGNSRPDATFAAPPVQIKTSTPTLLVDQTAVRYVRSPWGRAASADLGGFAIPTGPYFALVPSEPLAAQPTLPAGTFALTEGTLALLQIWADAERRSLLGTTPANPDSTWPRLQLANLDTPAAFASGVDDAGNASALVKIENAEWVATLGGKRAGNTSLNPHRAIAQPSFSGSLRGVDLPYPGVYEIDGTKLGDIDGNAETIVPGIEWVSLFAMQMPVHREYFTLAYDSWRGLSVLHGGSNYDNGEDFLDDTWVWDGVRWAQRPVLNPGQQQPNLVGAASAFDPVRGVTVLFGGLNDTGCVTNDVWEFDGYEWRRAVPTDPEGDGNPSPVSYGIAVAFDYVSKRVVMRSDVVFGDDDYWVWFWDGKSWEGFDPEAANDGDPEPYDCWRVGPSYDPVNHRLLHLSYYYRNQPITTYEWTGASWHVVDVPDPEGDGAPRGLVAHAMSISRREIIAIAGYTASTVSTWRYDGNSWALLPTAGGPDPAFAGGVDPGFVYDAGRDVYVLVTGYDEQQTWEFDGTTWRRRITTENPVAPVEIEDEPWFMGYDPVRNVILRQGDEGYNKWIERDWYPFSEVPEPPPGGRTAWPWLAHPDSGRIMEIAADGMRVLDEATWTVTPYLEPGPFATTGYFHTFVFEGDGVSEARLVQTVAGRVEVWELDEGAWTRLSDNLLGAEAPAIDDLAWDPVAQELITTDVSAAKALQTWSWTEADGWSLVPTSDLEGDGEPVPRRWSSLFFNEERGAVMLYGGTGNYATPYWEAYSDLWQWTGASWRQIATIDAHLDGDPQGRETVEVARHPDLRGLFVHGGWNADDYSLCRESWLLVDSSDMLPAVVLDFDLSAAELEGATLLAAELRVVAGGERSYDPLPPVAPGIGLWQIGQWVPGPSVSAASGELIEVAQPVPSDLIDGSRLLGYVHPGPLDESDEQKVLLDYAELKLRYHPGP